MAQPLTTTTLFQELSAVLVEFLTSLTVNSVFFWMSPSAGAQDSFFVVVQDFYRDHRFCDLSFSFPEENNSSLSCHGLILCSFSRLLYRVMTSSESAKVILLSDWSRSVVKKLLDRIYQSLTSSTLEIHVSESRTRIFFFCFE